MKKLVILLSSAASFAFLQGQSLSPTVVATAGGHHISASGSLSSTVGETVTQTLSNGLRVLTQGFQQPSKDVSASVEEQPAWTANAYPNPAQDVLNISIQNTMVTDYTWEIMDIRGSVVSQSFNPVTVDGSSTMQINVYELATGTYMLSLTDQKKKPYVIKFIKN